MIFNTRFIFMNDKEFNKLSDILFMKLEDLLDELDVDIQVNDNILIIEYGNHQIYVNKHSFTHQIWVSVQNTAHHFNFDGINWIDTKDKQEFFKLLSNRLSIILGYEIKL